MSKTEQTYIVTGGCGFIGANLVAALQERKPGCHVVVLDSMRTGSFANLVSACERKGSSFEGQVIGQSIRDVYWPDLIDTFTPFIIVVCRRWGLVTCFVRWRGDGAVTM